MALMRYVPLTVIIVLIGACATTSVKEISDTATVFYITDHNVVPPGDCYGQQSSYTVLGHSYWIEPVPVGYVENGVASWYGKWFHGKKTASGETFDMYQMSAAHKTLPMFSIVKVRNLENGKEIMVRINDRGPFVGERLIDLSYAAAKKIGMLKSGVVNVQITVDKIPDNA